MTEQAEARGLALTSCISADNSNSRFLSHTSRFRHRRKHVFTVVILTSNMSTATADSESRASISLPSRSRPPATTMKAQRILACVQCQYRKIKCNREFPCSNCIKTGVQCVPANLVPKQRRRRFPERELLDRLRRYEDLLKHHRIQFDPLHPSTSTTNEEPSPSVDKADDAEDRGQDVSSVVEDGDGPSPPVA